MRCCWGSSLANQSFPITNATTERIFTQQHFIPGGMNECVQMRFICKRACTFVSVCAAGCVYVCVSVPTPEHELYFVFATLLGWEMFYALAGQRCDIEPMRLHQTRLAKPLQRRYKRNNKAVN